MKTFLAILTFAVIVFSQVDQTTDTLITQQQVTVPQRVQRPQFRYISPVAKVGDSIKITVQCNKTITKTIKYVLTQPALDTNNVTRAFIYGYVDDVSK